MASKHSYCVVVCTSLSSRPRFFKVRFFCHASLTLWNILPQTVIFDLTVTTGTLKKRLKSVPYGRAFMLWHVSDFFTFAICHCYSEWQPVYKPCNSLNKYSLTPCQGGKSQCHKILKFWAPNHWVSKASASPLSETYSYMSENCN